MNRFNLKLNRDTLNYEKWNNSNANILDKKDEIIWYLEDRKSTYKNIHMEENTKKGG